jgi:hypothetical protein
LVLSSIDAIINIFFFFRIVAARLA